MKKQDHPSSRITRRQLAGAILATTATAATAAAQAPPSIPAAPEAELQAAREQRQRTTEALAKVPVPMEAEPAFHFSA